jgi:hypothetical protein
MTAKPSIAIWGTGNLFLRADYQQTVRNELPPDVDQAKASRREVRRKLPTLEDPEQ